MKSLQNQQPNSEELQQCKETVSIYFMSLVERAMKKTGLSEEFCRELVLNDMVRRRGLASPALGQQLQDGLSTLERP